jgi:hypothetical protein
MWPFARRDKRFEPRDDRVWYGYDALCEGVGRQAAAALASGKVVVVAQFAESLDDAEASVVGAGARCDRLQGTMQAADFREAMLRMDAGVVALVHSGQLKGATAPVDAAGAPGPSRPGVRVIAWERHPLRVRDDRVTEFVGELNAWFECELQFNAALDVPPMSMFAGAATQNILERLGMKATDSIEHRMLSKSVCKAQEKVAEQTHSDPKPGARSAREWLEAWKLAREGAGL